MIDNPIPFRSVFKCFAVLASATLTIGPFAKAQDEGIIPDKIEFNKHIRPILSENCFFCHGPDKNQREADMRLDLAESATAMRDGIAAIVPGNVEESELLFRVTTDDASDLMPPPDSNRSLTERDIELLRRWIEQGAEYEPHWAYAPIKRPEIPQVSDSDWPINEVDHFILSRLEAEGIAPSPQADRRTLARRLHLDLIGMPPTPEELDAFLNDKSEDAYEKLVDRLLDNPHFGERLAVYWLDLVRYADTVGYHGDQERVSWPYRDWVVAALNDNKPFDEFTREQLAGDLLPNPTLDQKIAAAYNRLNQITQEGGAQAGEYLAKYSAERVRTASTAWLGATLACAECHDHKYDPYTTRDFYAFAAFFADIDEVGVYNVPGYGRWEPLMAVPTDEQRQRLTKLDGRLAELKAQLAENSPELDEAARQWARETRAQLDKSERTDFAWVDDQQDNGGETSSGWNFVSGKGHPVFSGERSRFQEIGSDNIVQHYFHKANNSVTLADGDKFYFHIYLDPERPPKTVMLQIHSEKNGWLHRAFWGGDHIAFGAIGDDTADHRLHGELPKAGEWVRMEVDPARIGLEPGDVVNGMAFTQFAGKAWWDKAGVNTANPITKLTKLPATVREALALDAGDVEKRHVDAVLDHYRLIAPELQPIRDNIAKVEAEHEQVRREVPLMIATEATEPRTIRVLPRGNWMDESGEVVQPAVPEFLPDLESEDGERLTRLDLAEWITSDKNPLTARVFVNRLWKMYFGTGISKQLEDLGSQGEWPRHPELLDWMASEFRHDWDIKGIIKKMVMSRAYRQSSDPRPDLKELDPYNRLVARQSSFRLDAEFIRDTALTVSGLLEEKMGGPSARPYQPKGYYRELNFPKREYQPHMDANQWRRGVYTHWQRSFVHPAMLAFDAPGREECTAQREVSNTPLQALVLLNDPTFVEAARVFGARILREGGDSFDERLEFAFVNAVSRPPSEREEALARRLYEQQVSEYKANPELAEEIRTVGISPVTKGLAPAEHAAWTAVARVVLNLHETITRY